MNKINRQHLNEYLHYLITESNIVQTIFDDAIYDVVNIIRETIHRDYIKCNELNYIGWCYDNVNRRVVRSENPDKYHPICIYYYTEDIGGTLNVDTREVEGLSREELEHDPICIGVSLLYYDMSHPKFNIRYGNIPRVVLHEFSHIMDMWKDQYTNAVNDGRNIGYTKISEKFFKQHGITVPIQKETFDLIRYAMNIISITEIDAICTSCDNLINDESKESIIIETIKDGVSDDEKAELFIERFSGDFGFYNSLADIVADRLSVNPAKKNDINQALLFAQVLVYFGISKDKTGGYMNKEQWLYTNDILTGKRPIERATIDTILEANATYTEIVVENYAKVKKTVIDSLKEIGIIKKSNIYESIQPVHCANIYSKVKVPRIKGFAGNPELLLFQQYEDLHPVVQELCNAYTKLYETDELQHHLMNEGEIRIGNNVY